MWFREGHSPKTASTGTSDAAALFQGGQKFRHMDAEPGHGIWPVSQVWGTSLGLFCLVVQMKSTSYPLSFSNKNSQRNKANSVCTVKTYHFNFYTGSLFCGILLLSTVLHENQEAFSMVKANWLAAAVCPPLFPYLLLHTCGTGLPFTALMGLYFLNCVSQASISHTRSLKVLDQIMHIHFVCCSPSDMYLH